MNICQEPVIKNMNAFACEFYVRSIVEILANKECVDEIFPSLQ